MLEIGTRAERWDEQTKNNFLKEYSLTADHKEKKYFMCTKCEISPSTKRVIYMKFEDYRE